MYFLERFSEFLWGLPLIVTIIFSGIFFSLGAKLFQFRYFGHIMKETFGKLFDKKRREVDKGEGVVSPLEAVSIAIGGAVGTGNIGGIIVAISVFLFALSTSGGWYAYFEILIRHLLGDRTRAKEIAFKLFKLIYPIPGFLLVLVAVLKEMPSARVWLLGDIASGVPTFINVIAILILSRRFFELLKDYKARYMGVGVEKADFKVFYEDGVKESLK